MQWKGWSTIVGIIGIIFMIAEKQFGGAIGLASQMLDPGSQQVQQPQAAAPAPQPSPAPMPQPTTVADIPQPQPLVQAPAPQQQPDPNRYVVKATDHLWVVQDSQMVQSDELPAGTEVEYLRPYESSADYARISELDANGSRLNEGVIRIESIEPLTAMTTDDEASIDNTTPNVTFLNIQSQQTRIAQVRAAPSFRAAPNLMRAPGWAMHGASCCFGQQSAPSFARTPMWNGGNRGFHFTGGGFHGGHGH